MCASKREDRKNDWHTVVMGAEPHRSARQQFGPADFDFVNIPAATAPVSKKSALLQLKTRYYWISFHFDVMEQEHAKTQLLPKHPVHFAIRFKMFYQLHIPVRLNFVFVPKT